MKIWLRVCAFSMLFVMPACGGGDDGGGDPPTPAEACANLDMTACERTLECFTTEDLMQSGISTIDDCIRIREDARQMTAGLTCAQFTEDVSNCADGELYNATVAATCADIVVDLTCAEFLSNPTPGDCNLICEAASN